MSRRGCAILFVIVCYAFYGCATIGYREPQEVGSIVIGSRVDRVRTEDAVAGEVQQTNDEITIYVTKQCIQRNQKVNSVSKTFEEERYIDDGDLRWTLVVVGGCLIGVGALMAFNAEEFSESDREEQQEKGKDDYLSPTGYRVGGGILSGIGVTGLIIALVDTIRASGSASYSEVIEEPGDYVGETRSCGEVNYPNAEVIAAVDGEKLRLGRTDRQGILKITEEFIRTKTKGRSARIEAAGTILGYWPL